MSLLHLLARQCFCLYLAASIFCFASDATLCTSDWVMLPNCCFQNSQRSGQSLALPLYKFPGASGWPLFGCSSVFAASSSSASLAASPFASSSRYWPLYSIHCAAAATSHLWLSAAVAGASSRADRRLQTAKLDQSIWLRFKRRAAKAFWLIHRSASSGVGAVSSLDGPASV